MTSQSHGRKLDKIKGALGIVYRILPISLELKPKSLQKIPEEGESMELKGGKLKEHFLHTWV